MPISLAWRMCSSKRTADDSPENEEEAPEGASDLVKLLCA